MPQKKYHKKLIFFLFFFSFFDKLSIREQAELILVMCCNQKRQARAEPELNSNTSLTQAWAVPKRPCPSQAWDQSEYSTTHHYIYLGSWYSWYSVVSMHLHRKYVYITVHSKICQKVQFRATKNLWKYRNITSLYFWPWAHYFAFLGTWRERQIAKQIYFNISYFGMPWKP